MTPVNRSPAETLPSVAPQGPLASSFRRGDLRAAVHSAASCLSDLHPQNIPLPRSVLCPFCLSCRNVGTLLHVATSPSFPEQPRNADAHPNSTALFRVFRQAACGGRRPLWSSTGLRPAALQRLVPSGFFAVAPVGLLREEKSIRHSALASLGLPARSSAPPAIAPAVSC
jgi:hypothetical protein